MFKQLFNNFRDDGIRRGLIKGDPRSIDSLFEAYSDQLFGYSLSMTRNRGNSEEAVQNVFLRLVQNPDSLSKVHNLKAYLYRAVRNETLNVIRKAKRETPVDSFLEEGVHGNDSDDRMMIESALGNLNEEQREVIILKFYLDMSFREIGALLEISSNTASSRYRYGLENLRKILGVTINV